MSQYTYFAIKSETMTAAEVTFRLGWNPTDSASVAHNWPPLRYPSATSGSRCDERGLRIDEQIDRVLARLTPVSDSIAELCRESEDVFDVLQVVRYFNDEEGEEPQPDRTGDQHLLGWSLERSVIEFPTATGTELDVDEYD